VLEGRPEYTFAAQHAPGWLAITAIAVVSTVMYGQRRFAVQHFKLSLRTPYKVLNQLIVSPISGPIPA
jgi:hypothetical protein